MPSLQKAWYQKQRWVYLLAPLSALFWLISSLRRLAFAYGLKSVSHSRLPVIVVGNIGIGGNGKTPLSLSLIDYLQSIGHVTAVLSRGYGGSQTEFPYLVSQQCRAELVGDEPALIAKRNHGIVVIDPKRSRGAKFIETQTAATVIICDDGLQHYALARDIELCVLDKRGLGNGYLLPMGPLREGAWRLKTVDACVLNANTQEQSLRAHLGNIQTPMFNMQLQASVWVNLRTKEKRTISQFNVKAESTIAMAGIGDPNRFFDTLETMGIHTKEKKPYPDHYQFEKSDIVDNYTLLMTEKDAVKCYDFAHEDCWYLQVDATLPQQFFEFIHNKLKDFH